MDVNDHFQVEVYSHIVISQANPPLCTSPWASEKKERHPGPKSSPYPLGSVSKEILSRPGFCCPNRILFILRDFVNSVEVRS